MVTANRTSTLDLADQLDADIQGLKASLHVARGAAILKIEDSGAIPDKAIPDALWAAVGVLEAIERKTDVFVKAALRSPL